MRQLFITLSGLLITLFAHAQCNTTFVINPLNSSLCAGSPISFQAIGTTDCTGPYQVHYSWHAEFVNSNSSFNYIIGSESTGIAPSTTSIPMYTHIPTGPGNYRACISAILLDNAGDTLSAVYTCSSPTLVATPLMLFPYNSNDPCGQNNCVGVQVSGGTAPYVYSWNGLPTSSAFYCTDEPGMYMITVSDALGCSGSTAVTINPQQSSNSVCENAQPLINDQEIIDSICFVGATTIACSNSTYYQAGWYSINSGENTILQLGLGTTFLGAPGGIYGNVAIEIYEETEAGSCANSSLFTCLTGNDCAALATPITVVPNTTYYIRVLSQWTTTLVFNIAAHLSNQASPGLCGCTNNESCNYDPEAIVNDGSCGWNGCMDQNACNYISYATCDDGSCIYGNDFSGQIFNDINGDGVRNVFPNAEPLLSSIGSIYIAEADITVFPNTQGNFVIPSLPLGTYTVTFIDPNGYWVLNANTPLSITLPTCNGLNIPLTPTSGAAANVYPTSAWMWSNFHCSNGFYPGVYLQNTGTTTINGTYTIEFDPKLAAIVYNSDAGATMNAGSATFTISGLAPGATAMYQLHIPGPGVSYVGQSFTFTSHLTLTDNNGIQFYTNDWNRNAVVTCAYDPNDKSASPEGYEEPHFILADTEIEYRIRFQNTGNAPAFDVVIEDQIDIAQLDLSTLVPTGASHSYSTIIEPNGRVRFVFNNIMLPDSVHNEPESHGYITYKIRPRADVLPGDVIENTASIFFDDNPPIVTNTTMHTIYDCDWWQAIDGEFDQCAGIGFSFIDFSSYVETYTWRVNGEVYVHPNPLVNPNEFVYPTDLPGDYQVELTRTNPLCETTQSFVLHVRPVPVANVFENNGTLFTDADGIIFQWFLNEVPISGATSNSYTPTVSGNYQVVVSNEWFCNDTSLPYAFTYVGVEESENATALLYPNPAQDEVRAVLPAGQYNVTVLNAQGSRVQQWNNIGHTTSLSIGEWAKGLYHFRFTGSNGKTYHATVVKQ